jgi:AbiJ N-terminal domain 4
LRFQVLELARELGTQPSKIRQIACRILLEAPDPDNSSRSEIWDEVVWLLRNCEWYRVYDIAEALYAEFSDDAWGDASLARQYEKQLNEFLREGGVGWQMQSGRIVTRGSEPFEMITREAPAVLDDHGRPTAAGAIHEALVDLSRRPRPDVSGAIHHAMAALECVMRDLSGESSATLGDLLKRQGQALSIPTPLDQALIKLWGYASEHGRHLREGREPGFEEAELVVTAAAAASVYLSKKFRI